VKVQQLTNNDELDIQAHPLYQEAAALMRELNKLTEGKALNRSEIHDLFKGAEQAMTAGGNNRNILGKAGDLAGALGAKIKGLGQALQDTTVVQGVDAKFEELKQKVNMGMGKSPEGSKVLRALDTYKQTVQRYPTTSKFFWGVAGVLTGLLTSGAAPIVALGAIKMIDGLMQGEQFSTAAGRATRPVGAALGAKALATAGKAIANTDIPDIDNPFKPNPPGPDNVTPPGPDQVVPPGAETQTITAKSGDTMTGIADKYKVNPDELAKLNPGKFGPQGNPNILNPGDQIVLPKNIDAAAYKGAYQGDNAMTAQNIQNKMDAGQLGSDQGMAAKRIAADAAAAKAKTAATSAPSAQTPAPGAGDQVITPRDPNIMKVPGKVPAGGTLQRAESVIVKKGRGILEGFDIVTMPTAQLIDKEQTVRQWALNESIGRARPTSVQLTEQGVRTLFYNIENLYEFALDERRRGNYDRERSHAMGQAAGRAGAAQAATQNAAAKAAAEKAGRAAPAPVKGKMTAQQFAQSNPAAAAAIQTGTPDPNRGGAKATGNPQLDTGYRDVDLSADPDKIASNQEGGTVFSRPANANDPAAMAKNAGTSAANTRSNAGPVGKLPGDSAPAGNTMPYLAADPEGKFKTTGKGPLGGKLMRGIEGGLRRFSNWAGDSWREATTKVTLNTLLRHWKDDGSPTDSDKVAQVLVRKKVPNEIIQQLYQQLGFPAPKLATDQAAGAPAATSTTAAGDQSLSDDDFVALVNDALQKGKAITPEQKARLDAMREKQGLRPVDIAVADPSATPATSGAGGTGGTGATQASTAGTGAIVTPQLTIPAAQGDGQQAQATAMILPQIARMTSMMYADDLITIIDTAMSVLSRAAPPVYIEKLKQFRGTATGRGTEKPAEIIKRTKGKRSKGKGGAQDPVTDKKLGPSKVVSNNPGAPTQAEREKFDQRVAQAGGQANEQTRVYGGKYIRESADTKLAREFENFIIESLKS
jgi:LysM repeat protein